MSAIRLDRIYPIIFNRKYMKSIKKNGHYFEPILDSVVYFLEANFKVKQDFRVISAAEIRSGRLPREVLWKNAMDNLYRILKVHWSENKTYAYISSLPRQFGAAAILHPLIHDQLRENFGDSYIILPYSSTEIVVVQSEDASGLLEAYREELKEVPAKWELSKNIYIADKGIITAYPETQSQDIIPLITNNHKRRKHYGTA